MTVPKPFVTFSRMSERLFIFNWMEADRSLRVLRVPQTRVVLRESYESVLSRCT